MKSVKVFVPCDSTALAVGAERVAGAIAAEAAQRGCRLCATVRAVSIGWSR